MSLSLRASPSGPVTSPEPTVGTVGYAGASPLVFTLQPSGHKPGIYLVSMALFVRAVASGGNFSTSVLSWNEPFTGSTTALFAPGSPTVLGSRLNVLRKLPSTGLAPITYTLTPTSITGSLVLDLICCASLSAEYLLT